MINMKKLLESCGTRGSVPTMYTPSQDNTHYTLAQKTYHSLIIIIIWMDFNDKLYSKETLG